jgi:hypothetical protein
MYSCKFFQRKSRRHNNVGKRRRPIIIRHLGVLRGLFWALALFIQEPLLEEIVVR